MSIELCTSTLKKLNSRIIPFIIICYFAVSLDKTDISITVLQINADLRLAASMYGLGVGMFYIFYIIFEIPSNLIITRVGARIWIARIMITWEMVSAGTAFVQTPTQLYAIRFLLGIAEAGFTPEITYYISCWFPKRNRARAMSFFYMESVLVSIIGLPVSGLVLNMHGIADVAGWRWLLAIEGVPAIVLGALVLWLLPSGPQKAAWLSEAEKDWLTTQIAVDNRGAVVSQHASWSSALESEVVLLLSLVWFPQAFGSIGTTLFLPLILKGIASEQSDVVISLLSAVPFIFACLFMYLNGCHSDLAGERAWHMGLPLILAGFSLAVATYVDNLLVAYLLLMLAAGFNFALTPVFWAVTTEKLVGVATAASIISINIIANFVGLGLSPLLGKIKDLTNSYHSGLLIVAVALALGGVISIIVSRSGQKPSVFYTLKEDKL